MLLLGSQIIAAFTKSFSFEKDQSLDGRQKMENGTTLEVAAL